MSLQGRWLTVGALRRLSLRKGRGSLHDRLLIHLWSLWLLVSCEVVAHFKCLSRLFDSGVLGFWGKSGFIAILFICAFLDGFNIILSKIIHLVNLTSQYVKILK